MDPELQAKKQAYEKRKARTKLALHICTICGAKGAKACQGCGTTAYCSTDCQRIDWRDRGHRKVCKKIQAAEAARAETPTPPPSPPRDVFYGPAPRSHADEVRARIAAEHEAARVRREANPEREPLSARFGSRCPICLEEWDVNAANVFRVCCCRRVCQSCEDKIRLEACPLCRLPRAESDAENLARLRRHVENEVPEAIAFLGIAYRRGLLGLVKSDKKAAKIWKRAVELGDINAMIDLGKLYWEESGVKLDKKKVGMAGLDASTPPCALARGPLRLDGDDFLGRSRESRSPSRLSRRSEELQSRPRRTITPRAATVATTARRIRRVVSRLGF